MKLASIANRNYSEPGRIAYNAAMYVAVEQHQGKEMLVCRPHAHLVGEEAFMGIFRQLGSITEPYTSPRCLRCITLASDERGEFWIMTPGKYTSLAQLMVDNPNARLEQKWTDNIIAQLIETAQYLHNLDQQAWELTPQSILVTKGGINQIALMPPLSVFMPVKSLLYDTPDESVAPELFNTEEPDQRTDMYGIGRIIQYLHPYPSLPFKYSAPTKKAVSEKMSDRPTRAEQMLDTINTRGKGGKITHVIVSVAAVLAIIALLLFFPWTNDNEIDIKNLVNPDSLKAERFDDSYLTGANSLDPLVNTNIESATEAEKDRMLERYLHDSSYLSMDTAASLSPQMKEYQKQMMVLAAEKFRARFKQQARATLAKVYTKENMASQEKFLEESKIANEQLVRLQDVLATQYQVDPTTAIRIAGEVQDEVIEEIKKK